jgi:hypothetical protein
MRRWFKKKNASLSEDLRRSATKFIAPQALAVAIAETVSNYTDDVAANRIAYPAHRRKNASVVEIWRDLRLEALHKLFNFGKTDIYLLAEHRRQLEILRCFLDEGVHPKTVQQGSDSITDTLQAISGVYAYLTAAGSEVADRETDFNRLKLKKALITDKLMETARTTKEDWADFERAISSPNEALPSLPLTMLEVIYKDITEKAKSIALSAVFGPSYEAGMKHDEKLLIERGGDATAIRAVMNRVLTATDPDNVQRS